MKIEFNNFYAIRMNDDDYLRGYWHVYYKGFKNRVFAVIVTKDLPEIMFEGYNLFSDAQMGDLRELMQRCFHSDNANKNPARGGEVGK